MYWLLALNRMESTILLTFDVEDWFQVENLKKCIPFSSWPDCELRVEKNVHKILDLLDSIQHNPITPFSLPFTAHGKDSPYSLCSWPEGTLRATFFVLGWLAKRLPHLVREIKKRGHEIASHGYSHELCYEVSYEEVKKDLEESKKILEDIIGDAVYGYRAPNFSINQQILWAIEEAGYLYDSSYNSYRLNKRYGRLTRNQGDKGLPYKISDRFYEIPVSNLKIGRQVFHWSGGGYFRLIPPSIFVQGVKRILGRQGIYIFYTHSWEIDPDQPKMRGIPAFLRFRHYVNLNKTLMRLHYLLNAFKGCSFLTCREYLQTLQPPQSIHPLS